MSEAKAAADPMSYYGMIGLDRVDVRSVACWSLDLRAETGLTGAPDESALCAPGTFELSVVAPVQGEAIGEIRFWLSGREVRLVGKLTQRPGIIEVTPDILTAARDDASYLKRLRDWLGLAA